MFSHCIVPIYDPLCRLRSRVQAFYLTLCRRQLPAKALLRRRDVTEVQKLGHDRCNFQNVRSALVLDTGITGCFRRCTCAQISLSLTVHCDDDCVHRSRQEYAVMHMSADSNVSASMVVHASTCSDSGYAWMLYIPGLQRLQASAIRTATIRFQNGLTGS